MKATINRRAIAYARRYPGYSSTQIANALRANTSTVSAALYRAVKSGKLGRTVGGGPAGGHTYGPLLPRDRLHEQPRWHYEIVELVRTGLMINAIKRVREETGLSLRESLDIVHQERHAALGGAARKPMPEYQDLADRCTAARKGQQS